MRIYTSADDPLDFCVGCMPSPDEAREEFGDIGDGPDDRGNCFDYDVAHPAYDDDIYVCYRCRTKLYDG